MPKRSVLGFEYAPTTNVRTDFKRFMNQYLAKNTVRFEQFSEVWRERNMSYIYAGRCTDREAREFVERVMLIAQEYFLSPYQFQVRVGGLYLLYSIYQTQPLLPKVQIRVTPTQWQDTVVFQQQAAQQNHLDVVFVFQRLLQDQAFLFCYTSSEMNLHSSVKDTEEREDNLADSLKEEKSTVISLFNYESLEKLSYLQDQYQQMKISLAGPDATKPDKSLDVVQEELVEDIVVLLQSFKEKVASFSRNRQRTEAASQEQEPVPETTGGRRQLLKTQAFNQLKAHANKRHKLVVVNNSSPAKTRETAGTSKITRTEVSPPVTKDTQNVTKNTQNFTKNTHNFTKNTQKPVSKVSDIDADDSSSTSDSDVEYIPLTFLNIKKNGTTSQARQEDKVLPLKKGSVVRDLTKAMEPVTASTLNIKDGKSHDSMPFLAIDVAATESHIPSSNQISSQRMSVRNEDRGSVNRVAEIVPVRKRGRPRIYSSPEKINITEILVTPKFPLQESSKENPSRINKMPSAKNKSDDISGANQNNDNNISLTNKIAFKWKRPGKRIADQATSVSPHKEGMALEKTVAESAAPAKKRGRPRMYFDPTAEIIPTEVVVYPKVQPQPNKQVKAPTGKYEMVYFPVGKRQAADLPKSISPPESGSLSEAAKEMMSKANQTKHKTETKQDTPKKGKTKGQVRKLTSQEQVPGTVTEIIVSKEVGKPVVMESITMDTSSKKDEQSKKAHVREASGGTDLTKNLPRDSSSGSPSRTLTTEQNNVPEPAKIVKNKAPASTDPIQRLKERCKRKRDEKDEPIDVFVKKCMAMERERPHFITVLSSDEEELESDCSVQEEMQKKSKVTDTLKGISQSNMQMDIRQTVIPPAVTSKFIQEFESRAEKGAQFVGTKIIKTISDKNLLPWTSICSKLSSDPPRSPANSGDRKRSPTKSGDRKRSPTKSGDRKRSPTKSGDRTRSPAKSGDRARSPANSGDRARGETEPERGNRKRIDRTRAKEVKTKLDPSSVQFRFL